MECCRTGRLGVVEWDVVVEQDVVDRVGGCCIDHGGLSGGLEEEGTTAGLVVLAVVGRMASLAGFPSGYTGVCCVDSEGGKHMPLSVHSEVDMSLGVPPHYNRLFVPSWNSRSPGSSRKGQQRLGTNLLGDGRGG